MKLTIFKRLTVGYAVIMVLIVFLGVYVTLKLKYISNLTRSIGTVDSKKIEITERLSDQFFSQVGFERKFFISTDQDFVNQFWKIHLDFLNNLEQLKALLNGNEDIKLYAGVKRSYDDYLNLFREQNKTLNKNKDLIPWQYRQARDNIIDQINRGLRSLIKKARFDRDNRISASSRISSNVLEATMIIGVLVIVVGLIISFYNTRSINRSILLLKGKTKEVASGKFSKISDIASPPEIKELADDFNLMCERLQEVDELKEDFISSVSHKLRTPLTAIREASSMLLGGSYVNEPEKQQELLRITKNECERLINSVNRILDFSRMEADMMDFRFNRRQLVPVIQKTILKLAPIAQRKRIDLELRPPSELPAVWIDEERMAQVMENLLGNALKYTAEQGKVMIYAALKNSEKPLIEVAVADTGCGVPKEDLSSIFNKYKRVKNGSKNVRGTGLGLSIAKYIVSSHGGKIWAKSRPGKGSMFFFTLPVL